MSAADSTHPDSARSIWVFTPSRTDPEQLEAILVQRHDLLRDAVERVRESALTGNKHHLLFVGPRGCGKTHLVTLIVSRISADAEVSDHLRLAWLNEDETCTSLLELLIKVHAALEKRYPEEFRAENMAGAYERKPDAALDFVSQRLLAALASRTLVIVTENLDSLFQAMGEQGQKQLRAFIQEHPQIAFVATAQRLVEDLSARTSPFFGFFQTEHLKPLTVEEAATLLQNIARIQGKRKVAAFLASSRGRSRVRALHHLSGGNHRIYIVLSQFITRESMEGLVGPFLKMVDELTPYYQERVRWLPPLQRKIVEFLCTREDTVPVKEIARRLFATAQTISSQLHDLREKGYVESSQRGRESLYEISEPLMRICVEVKDNQNTHPLRLLVDFLRVWYDEAELERRLGAGETTAFARPYLEHALERNRIEGSLRTKLLYRDFGEGACLGLTQGEIQKVAARLQEALLDAGGSWQAGDFQAAIRALEEAQHETVAPADQALIHLAAAFLHSNQRDAIAEISALSRLIELPGASAEHVARALVNRGVARYMQSEIEGCMVDLTHVVETPGVSSEAMAWALVNRGVAYAKQGEPESAVSDFTDAIDLSGAPTVPVAWALINRGMAQRQQGDLPATIADFTRVIELPGASAEQVAKALLHRGGAQQHQGRHEQALADYTQIIHFPGAAGADIIHAHLALAGIHFGTASWSEGFAALEAGLKLGAEQSPPIVQPPVEVIDIIFSAGLTQEGRNAHARRLYSCYARHSAVAVLGGALVRHLGDVFAEGAPWPASDNLDQWLAAWEHAAGGSAEFKLPLRLLRTGIRFVKSGGKDQGVLLDLTASERTLLRQALDPGDDRP